MNLNQLYYFKELAKERQFSKAAKNLYISQPSLSNSIKSLEKELNCQLINRNGGQTILTEYGKIFYEAAITSITSLDKSFGWEVMNLTLNFPLKLSMSDKSFANVTSFPASSLPL